MAHMETLAKLALLFVGFLLDLGNCGLGASQLFGESVSE